jgi:hypothetical protein
MKDHEFFDIINAAVSARFSIPWRVHGQNWASATYMAIAFDKQVYEYLVEDARDAMPVRELQLPDGDKGCLGFTFLCHVYQLLPTNTCITEYKDAVMHEMLERLHEKARVSWNPISP